MALNNITKVCFVLIATVVLFDGIVCPFPPEDPRHVFNPVIVPWWRFAPRKVREFLHLKVVGKPLPPDPMGLGPLPTCPVLKGPCKPKPRKPYPHHG
jgi:hypothetical protein